LLFDFSPESIDDEAGAILRSETAPKVVAAFARKLEQAGELDYGKYAAIIEELKKETGIKGKNLFHPIRVALTAKASGLELDKFIPLVEEGARLSFPKSIKDCLTRVIEIRKYFEGLAE
jgi:nondiscriminating glutamyl-tRNA synthetase